VLALFFRFYTNRNMRDVLNAPSIVEILRTRPEFVVDSAGGGPASISAAEAHVSTAPIALTPLLLRAVSALLEELSRQRLCEVAKLASRFMEVYRVRLAEAVRTGAGYDKVTTFLREHPNRFVLASVGSVESAAICCATPGSAGERDLLSVASTSFEAGATAYEEAEHRDDDDVAHARDRKGGRRVLQKRADHKHNDAHQSNTPADATSSGATTTTTTDGADASQSNSVGVRRGGGGARRIGKGGRGRNRGRRGGAAAMATSDSAPASSESAAPAASAESRMQTDE